MTGLVCKSGILDRIMTAASIFVTRMIGVTWVVDTVSFTLGQILVKSFASCSHPPKYLLGKTFEAVATCLVIDQESIQTCS